jgi:lipid-A-disaccharide synthase
LLAARGSTLPVELCLGRTPEIVEISSCCVMVSGSVSLEMLVRAKPAVVIYRIGPFTYWIFRTVVRINSMTLPNLIAKQRLLPEWCVVFRPERDVRAMSAVIKEWLGNPLKLAESTRDLRRLRDEIVKGGATARTADRILSHLAPSDESLRNLTRAAA